MPMPLKLEDVCRHIRSKNAGPFWITTDLFFRDEAAFARFAHAPEISPSAVAHRLKVAPDDLKVFYVPDLCVVKFSYPRFAPQGGVLERDMHGGQQYVDLAGIVLDSDESPMHP
jgi:hypothetical protein